MKGMFQTRYKKRNFELIEVKEAVRSGAFDDAIRGKAFQSISVYPALVDRIYE